MIHSSSGALGTTSSVIMEKKSHKNGMNNPYLAYVVKSLLQLVLMTAVFTSFPLWASSDKPAFTHGYAVCMGGSTQLLAAQHADASFPLMSVIKFPLAILVLHEVEQGHLTLSTRYHLSAKQLPTDTWSPLAQAHPQGGEFTLQELLQAAVSQSDNNACAQLFRLIGGAPALQAYLRREMGEDIAITITHGEDYFRKRSQLTENNATPRAMVQLLYACFIEKRLLSPALTQLLWDIMSSPSAGAPRLAAGIPTGAALAHKTGSSGTNAAGYTLAHNDVGVLRLPDGRTDCISSFIHNSSETPATMEAAHAELAKRAACLLEGNELP